jgi:hypothetical protein
MAAHVARERGKTCPGLIDLALSAPRRLPPFSRWFWPCSRHRCALNPPAGRKQDCLSPRPGWVAPVAFLGTSCAGIWGPGSDSSTMPPPCRDLADDAGRGRRIAASGRGAVCACAGTAPVAEPPGTKLCQPCATQRQLLTWICLCGACPRARGAIDFLDKLGVFQHFRRGPPLPTEGHPL